MVKGPKKLSDGGSSNPEAEERKRLKKLAHAKNLLSETPAKFSRALTPSETVLKHHGKDILKKSQRKNRYLFSFPGLLSPNSGGKIGELTNLGSKNPILYLEFPQGRMKLFGTIVYPKNRYLTLQFSKGGKNATCDDYFDTMIVFSDACWIGRKDKNQGEARLDFPVEFYEGQRAECDFQGGAGATGVHSFGLEQESSHSDADPLSPQRQNNLKSSMSVTPVRHSERTAGKMFKFAEVSSEDDGNDNGTGVSRDGKEAAEKNYKFHLHITQLVNPEPAVQTHVPGTSQILTKPITEKHTQSVANSKAVPHNSHGPLVQATISSLFKKVETKMATRDPLKGLLQEVSGEKLWQTSTKKAKHQMSPKKAKSVKAGELFMKDMISEDKIGRGSCRRKKQDQAEDEEDIEEFSSSSED
ncbi:hypothetical protein Ancab_029816 [Ancistrocladus abbreviatus]